MIDSSSIRVHQHGANGKKGDLKKPRQPPLGTSLEAALSGLAVRQRLSKRGLGVPTGGGRRN
jgi:hypothetical protein